jgi:AcrR family transcriptional regulator
MATDDKLRALIAEVVTEKLDEKLGARRAAHEADGRARSALKAEVFERLNDTVTGALEVWTRQEPGARRRGLGRDEIAAAAVRIADAEGVGALSMRRIAADLGVGTMTLYHYVKTKEELLALVNDLVMGEVVVPDDEPLPDDWRAALTVVAKRSRAAFARHPWTLDIADDPGFGPNAVRHFDQTLAAVAGLDLPLRQKLELVTAVDEYVFGHAVMDRNNRRGERVVSPAVIAYTNGLIASGRYPQLAAIVDELGDEGAWAVFEEHTLDDGRFERNLARILDGLAAGLGVAADASPGVSRPGRR